MSITQARYRTASSVDALSGFNHNCLRSATFFSGRDPAFLEKLTEYLQLEIFGTGKDILTMGQTGDKMYFLHRGEVEVLVGPELKRVAKLGSGSVFGEMALFGSQKRTATVRALEFCDCRSIHHHAFQSILKNFPAEQRFFEKLYEERKAQLLQAKLQQAQETQKHSGNRRRSAGNFQNPAEWRAKNRKASSAAPPTPVQETPSSLPKGRRSSVELGDLPRSRRSSDNWEAGLDDARRGSTGDVSPKKFRSSIGFYTGNVGSVLGAIHEQHEQPADHQEPTEPESGTSTLRGLETIDHEAESDSSGLFTDEDESLSGFSEGGYTESSRASTPHLHLPDLVRALPAQEPPRSTDSRKSASQEGRHERRSEGNEAEAADAVASQSNFAVHPQNIPSPPEPRGGSGPGRPAGAVGTALPQQADLQQPASGQIEAATQSSAVVAPEKQAVKYASTHSSSSRSPVRSHFNSMKESPTLSPNSSYTSLRSAIGRRRGNYSPPKSPSEREEELLDLAMELKGLVLKQYPRPPEALFDKLKHDNAALRAEVKSLKQQTAGSRRQPVLRGVKKMRGTV
mmetsp:Transcript_119895/g.220538  ORF Transcript_119895/g.220538 Transcript_119895/m.220538 type:complete len:569 (-) Transcript_119895:87-1793(-)